jgi:hypothetical protein
MGDNGFYDGWYSHDGEEKIDNCPDRVVIVMKKIMVTEAVDMEKVPVVGL